MPNFRTPNPRTESESEYPPLVLSHVLRNGNTLLTHSGSTNIVVERHSHWYRMVSDVGVGVGSTRDQGVFYDTYKSMLLVLLLLYHR